MKSVALRISARSGFQKALVVDTPAYLDIDIEEKIPPLTEESKELRSSILTLGFIVPTGTVF